MRPTIKLIRIPRDFLDHRAGRGLPTPGIQKTLRYQYDIRADDPALDELIADARHHTESVDTQARPELLRIVASAHATLHAIRTSQETSA